MNLFLFYFICARHRLQQLERESEELDQSFQAYLRRQQILKQQMSDDASKIWENYTLSKAALAQFDKIEDKHNIAAAVYQSKLADSVKVDHVLNSTFYDDVDIEEVLKDLREIKRLKSPRFNKNEAFPKNSLLTFKSHKNEFKSFNNRDEKEIPEKVDNRMKLIGKPSIILEKPIKPILEKPMKTVAVEVTSEPKIQLRNEEINSNVGFNSHDERRRTNDSTAITSHREFILEKPVKIVEVEMASQPKNQQQNEGIKLNVEINSQDKVNGSIPMTLNRKLNTKSEESIELKKLPNSEETNQNEEIASKFSDMGMKTRTLANGHTNDKHESDAIHRDAKQQDAEWIENETKSLSPLKVNDNIPTTAAESKVDLIEKLPIIVNGNGLKKQTSSATKINGFAKKFPTFEPIVSESDSAEISEQISIGQQRLIKSPDDFWI